MHVNCNSIEKHCPVFFFSPICVSYSRNVEYKRTVFPKLELRRLDFLKVARFSLNGPGTNDFYHLQRAKFTGGVALSNQEQRYESTRQSN